MKSRINDKIKELEKYLAELEEFLPEHFENYKKDGKTKAACERVLEKIMEAVIDISLLIIKFKKFQIPDDDNALFGILKENNIIPENVMKNMKNAKGMRNFIVHQYGKVDDEIVFDSLRRKVPNDVKKFIKEIKRSLNL